MAELQWKEINCQLLRLVVANCLLAANSPSHSLPTYSLFVKFIFFDRLGLAGERDICQHHQIQHHWAPASPGRKWVWCLLITGPGNSLMRQGFPMGRFWTSPLNFCWVSGTLPSCQDPVEGSLHMDRSEWPQEPSRKSLSRRRVKGEDKWRHGKESRNILRIYYLSVLQITSI